MVVRAINRDYPQFYSDAGVMLRLEPEGTDLLFTSELYRLVVRKDSPVGTKLNSMPVVVKDSEQFPSVHYKLEPDEYFGISSNGTIYIKRPVNSEALPSEGKGVVDLTVMARQLS